MDIYEVLRERIDSHPMGAPAHPSLNEILRMLFTPEQANLATHLTWAAQPASVISQVSGIPEDEVTRLCQAMIKKGIVYTYQRKGNQLYALLPLAPGLYEFPLMLPEIEGVDHDRLRNLWLEYFEKAWVRTFAEMNPAMQRVLPIYKTIDDDTGVLPFEQVADYFEGARYITVGKCACREMAHKCDAPIETCFYLNEMGQYLVSIGAAREVTREEAMDILLKCEDAGLIHQGPNTAQGGDVICNCCSCCCTQMRGKLEWNGFSPASAFLCRVDEEACTACSICVDRCRTNAITVNDFAVINDNLCVGCGLCAKACPEDAMAIIRREDAQEAVSDMKAWALDAVGKRGRTEDYLRNLKPVLPKA